MIKYIGSKRLLIETITQMVDECAEVETVLDLFSGTSRVGQALKKKGYRVAANDYTAYAHALARCYIEADAARYTADAERLLRELSTLPGKPGYFTETFCESSRYVHPKNGERVDAIRERIAERYTLINSTESTQGPSRYWRLAEAPDTRVGFISPHSHNFCATCNRVRVTVEGRLLLCLGNEHSADLKAVLRANPGQPEKLEKAIVEAMKLKPYRHNFEINDDVQVVRFMNMTGG